MGARVARVAKEKYENYVRKSDEFLRSAQEAERRGDWTATLSNAVHSAICMTDAMTVFYTGQRSSAQSHSETMKLLSRLPVSKDALDRNIGHLSSLLDQKNLAEYEDRMPTRHETQVAMRHIERFRRWALAMLPGVDRLNRHA